MQRYALFVDGSNLFGALKSLNLEVKDYEGFFAYLYTEALNVCNEKLALETTIPSAIARTYWYVVGSMDEWDLTLPQSQSALRKSFDRDKEVRDAWLANVGPYNRDLKNLDLREKAWEACSKDFADWYEKKRDVLKDMKKFYQAVRASTDLIDIIECGHWKVDFLHKWVGEKGLDTSLAVDMLALQQNYDVAIVVSGDADSIPSIRHMKANGKHVAAVEFIAGSPPESKGRTFSSRLREHADFVVRVYETELLRLNHAVRPTAPAPEAV